MTSLLTTCLRSLYIPHRKPKCPYARQYAYREEELLYKTLSFVQKQIEMVNAEGFVCDGHWKLCRPAKLLAKLLRFVEFIGFSFHLHLFEREFQVLVVSLAQNSDFMCAGYRFEQEMSSWVVAKGSFLHSVFVVKTVNRMESVM